MRNLSNDCNVYVLKSDDLPIRETFTNQNSVIYSFVISIKVSGKALERASPLNVPESPPWAPSLVHYS